MKEINNKLVAIYYVIYAVFAIGIVVAHLCPWSFGVLYGNDAVIAGYVVVIALLACVPTALILNFYKMKKQVDLDYYFKWNAIPMAIIAFDGILTVVGYSLLRDRSSLFAFLLAFVALIIIKPTNYKIKKYFESQEEV